MKEVRCLWPPPPPPPWPSSFKSLFLCCNVLCSPFNHLYCIRPDTKYTTLDNAVLPLPFLVFLQKGTSFFPRKEKTRKILSIYHLPSFCLQTDSLLVYWHYPLLSPYFFLAICFCCCYCCFLKNAVSFFFFGYKFIASHHLMIISSHHLSHNSCLPKPQQHLHQRIWGWGIWCLVCSPSLYWLPFFFILIVSPLSPLLVSCNLYSSFSSTIFNLVFFNLSILSFYCAVKQEFLEDVTALVCSIQSHLLKKILTFFL